MTVFINIVTVDRQLKIHEIREKVRKTRKTFDVIFSRYLSQKYVTT